MGMGEKWKRGALGWRFYLSELNAPDHRGEFHRRSLEAFR